MTQDVDFVCNSAIGLTISIMDSLFKVLSFIGVLWVISRMLTGGVLGYAALGSFIAVLIGKSLVYLSFQQTKNEADLRFKVASARNEAESIAFCKGEPIALSQAVEGAETSNRHASVGCAREQKHPAVLEHLQLLDATDTAPVMFPFYVRGDIEFGVNRPGEHRIHLRSSTGRHC